jgi:predicted nucleic acid-binding protein
MRRVFADTSYWIALLNPQDQLHLKALESSKRNSFDEMITTEMVLAELLNGFSDRGAHLRNAAVRAVDALRANRSVVIVAQSSEQFQNALTRYKTNERQGLESYGLRKLSSDGGRRN